jgi:hypothetical protein
METHKFRIGQTVRYTRTALGGGIGEKPTGNFRVVRLLPETQGRYQYQVESIQDGHQRVAMETEINK